MVSSINIFKFVLVLKTLIMTREEIGNKTIELAKEHNNLLLTFATGVGKSLASLKVINRLTTDKFYIIVKETNHITNWELEIQKHGLQDLLLRCEILCYDSLHKLTEKGNFILDECHAITPKRLELLKPLVLKRVIALSATIPYTKSKLLSKLANFYEYHISTSEAISWGILPNPIIYVHNTILDDTNKYLTYIKIKGNNKIKILKSCEFRERFKFLKQYKNLELHIKCTEVEYYNLLTEDLNYWKKLYFKIRKQFAKQKFLLLGIRRKRFVASCKTKLAESIIKSFHSNYRYIVFTNSIEQCEKLGNNIIHSKVKNKSKIIEDFQNKKTNSLFAVNMLKESMNFNDINSGLLIQVDSEELTFIQTLGRILRSVTPEFHLIITKDTMDEKYFSNVINNLENVNLKIIDYNK